MNDEIKINKLNKSITFINNGIAFSQFGIADEILDLITNLQQNYKLIEGQNRISLLEIERLKELNENASKVCMAEHKYGVDKAEEARDYKSRCEKASEYIDKQKKKMYKSRNKIAMFILMKLENILQNGSDDNE